MDLVSPEVEMGENVLTGHKFSNLLKSVSLCMAMVHGNGSF